MGLFKKKARTRPDRIMQVGWQFYHRPTTLEPVGTIFRIDSEDRRYIVDTLNIQGTRGAEAAGHIELQVEIGAGVLARLLGIGPEADSKVKFAEKIVFELSKPVREYTSDKHLESVLDPFLLSLKYRADNRYFMIRECRWADAMTYRLSKERIIALGGEATINESLTVGAELKTVSERLYEIDCVFPEAMRVMFLPEEIKPISAGLGGDEPELGRVPVKEPLVWKD